MQRAGVRSLGTWDELCGCQGWQELPGCMLPGSEMQGRRLTQSTWRSESSSSPNQEQALLRHICWYVWTMFTAVTYCTAFHVIDKLYFIYFLMDGHLAAFISVSAASLLWKFLLTFPSTMCKMFPGLRSAMAGIFVMSAFSLVYIAKSFPEVLVHVLPACTSTGHTFPTALPSLDFVTPFNFWTPKRYKIGTCCFNLASLNTDEVNHFFLIYWPLHYLLYKSPFIYFDIYYSHIVCLLKDLHQFLIYSGYEVSQYTFNEVSKALPCYLSFLILPLVTFRF